MNPLLIIGALTLIGLYLTHRLERTKEELAAQIKLNDTLGNLVNTYREREKEFRDALGLKEAK